MSAIRLADSPLSRTKVRFEGQADNRSDHCKKRSMMDTSNAVTRSFVREPAAGSTLDVLGVTHIYKATAAETGGSFSLWEAVVPPGKGAPLQET
jgi:hypothetical protein